MKFIGRSEKVELIDLKTDLSIKVDTGAFGNCLHVDKVEIINDKLNFSIGTQNYIFGKYKTLIVKNSFGEKQKRFLIFTKIKIGEKKYKVYLSLTDRKNMRYPMLLGRRFLYKFGYIVDVRKKNIYDRN